MKQTIKAVTFDACATLIHLVEPVGVSYAKVANEFGIEAEPSELEAAFREVWKRTAPPTGHSEKAWWSDLVREVFELSTGRADFTSAQDYDVFFERIYAHFAEPGVWQLDPDIPELFAHLDECGIRKAVISNFDARLLQILSELGIRDSFEFIITSNELGIAKPDKRIFHHAISKLDLASEEILHVGDDPLNDGDAAIAAGMNSFLVGAKYGRLIEIIDKFPLALT